MRCSLPSIYTFLGYLGMRWVFFVTFSVFGYKSWLSNPIQWSCWLLPSIWYPCVLVIDIYVVERIASWCCCLLTRTCWILTYLPHVIFFQSTCVVVSWQHNICACCLPLPSLPCLLYTTTTILYNNLTPMIYKT
jgi:hypothetical protein